MVYHNSDDFKREKFLSTLDKIEFNGHAYVSGDYETKESQLVVFCRTHKIKHGTTFTNYCRSKTGMPCWGKRASSQKLLHREFSEETLEKMKQAALNRIRLPGTGQNWRRSTEARFWEKRVKEMWGNECPISGNQTNLVMHHFFSGARYKRVELRDALLYNVNNGILIAKELHVDFHKRFGYEENTIEQFQTYLKDLQKLISSQAQQECWEGSETRVDDPHPAESELLCHFLFKSVEKTVRTLQAPQPVRGKEKVPPCPKGSSARPQVAMLLERIMKLQERLEEIKEELRAYDM